MDINEENFIIQLRKRNEKALEYVINNYGWVIKSIVKKEMYNLKNLQEECINDILLGVWNNINSFDEKRGEFKNWLGGITKFKCIDYKRRYLKDIIYENIDEFTTRNVDEYKLNSLEGIDVSGDVKIRIVYTKVYVNDQEKEGKWEFNFTINMEKLKQKTKEGKIEYKFKVDNGEEIDLSEYRIPPIGSVIYGSSINNDDRNNPYIIELRGTDSLGNDVRFVRRGGSDDLEMRGKNINTEAKFIKLTPYAMKFPKKNEKPEDMVKVGEEFTINLDK